VESGGASDVLRADAIIGCIQSNAGERLRVVDIERYLMAPIRKSVSILTVVSAWL